MNKIIVGIFIAFLILAAYFLWLKPTGVVNSFPGLKTDTSKTSIDLNKIISGGPGKDGIPAINNPKFISINEAKVEGQVQGILVKFDGERKYYPYNILVWHEIVNDSIGDNHFAVTFCPLCGSAIVFNRVVNGEILRFGVSGLLFESNLVMYDDKTESLWPQVKGEAVVGEFLGTKLEVLPMQLLTFSELKEKYSDTRVLSIETGFNRDYSFYPYGDYEQSEDLYFPVSAQDKRFPTKEIMYAFNFEGKQVAFPEKRLKDGEEERFEAEGKELIAKRKGEEIEVTSDGKIIPGYFVMWFSWATHNQKTGLVWEMN